MCAYDPLELLTPDDVTALLKVKKSWLYDVVERGDLPCVRLGRSLRFRRLDLEAFITSAA